MPPFRKRGAGTAFWPWLGGSLLPSPREGVSKEGGHAGPPSLCRRGGVQGNPIERVPLAPLFHRARRILFFKKAGSPAATQRSGCGGEEESGEAPPAAEKASRFRGSGAIGGPEGAGNRNAATVCKGATKRHEGCPPPQGVPNIAQFDPTTKGGFEAIGLRRFPPRPEGAPLTDHHCI